MKHEYKEPLRIQFYNATIFMTFVVQIALHRPLTMITTSKDKKSTPFTYNYSF